jgi:hypothetical protein
MNGPGKPLRQCSIRIGDADRKDDAPFSIPGFSFVGAILGASQHRDAAPATVNLQRQMDSVALLHPVIPYFREALEPSGDPRHSMTAHW